MAQRASLRASDADREQIAERLRHAAAEGRLFPEELEDRLGTALTARTYAELDALVADLPGGRMVRSRQSSLAPWVKPALALTIAIPLALAVIVALVLVITGVLAIWALWLALGWWFFGAHGRRRRGAHARSGFWV